MIMLAFSYAVALWATALGIFTALYVVAIRQTARLASPLWRPLFIIVIVWGISLVALPGTAINPLVGLLGGLGRSPPSKACGLIPAGACGGWV